MVTEITKTYKVDKSNSVFRLGDFSFWIKPLEGKRRTVRADYNVYPHQNRATLDINFADYTTSIGSPRKSVNMGGIACIHNVFSDGRHKYGINIATRQEQSISKLHVMRLLNMQLRDSKVPLCVRGEVRRQVKDFMSLRGKFAK